VHISGLVAFSVKLTKIESLLFSFQDDEVIIGQETARKPFSANRCAKDDNIFGQ